MSDPMSIAGSVAGLASVGFSIAKGLYQIADDMSVAGLEVRVYANEIDAFAKLLFHVQRTVDGLACSAKELKEIKTQIREILDNCDRILKPLQEVQKALLPLMQRFRESPSKMLQVALRVRWTFVSKGKVLFYRELLQRQHQLLDTHLSTVTLISLQGKKDPQMVEMLHSSLENSVTALNHTVATPTWRQAHAEAQLLLGSGSDQQPGSWESTDGEGPHSSQPLSGTPASSENDASTALVPAQPSGFRHEAGPSLVGMTEQEAQSVLAATSLDLDEGTLKSMEKMLTDTESAERKTIRLVSSKLPSRNTRGSRTVTSPTLLRSSDAMARCGPEVMGEWSKYTRRLFRPTRLRYEVVFQVPQFFYAKDVESRRGREIHAIDGTDESILATRTTFPSETEIRTPGAAQAGATSDRASWLVFLTLLQGMERDSRLWQLAEFAQTPSDARPLSLKRRTGRCMYVVPITRSWDTQPALINKPLAETNLASLVVAAAMLGVHWKKFDRTHHRYLAEGNGIILRGSMVDRQRVVFTFEVVGRRKFTDNHLILRTTVQNFCFGETPITREFQSKTVARSLPLAELYQVKNRDNYLRLANPTSLGETFATVVGCSDTTINHLLDEKSRVGHLFPVAFELLGMIGCEMYVEDSVMRVLPNPTYLPWPRDSFSLRRLFLAFRETIFGENSPFLPGLLESLGHIRPTLDLLIDRMNPQGTGQLSPPNQSCLPLFAGLHGALLGCEDFFSRYKEQYGGPMLRGILRSHFEALSWLAKVDTGTYRDGSLRPRFRDLDTAASEDKESALMWIYARVVFSRVSQASPLILPDRAIAQIWITLVFRMLCWLSLHDFHPDDVQVPGLGEAVDDLEEMVYIA